MNSARLDISQILGYAGAALFVASPWVPMLSVLLFGDIDFLAAGFGDGPLFLLIAAATFYFAYARHYRAMAWSAAAGAAVLALSFYHVSLLLKLPSRAAGSVTSGLLAPVVAAATDWVASNTIHYGWGWAIPIAAVGCAAIGSLTAESQSGTPKPVRRGGFVP
jgi:hypothetical protein